PRARQVARAIDSGSRPALISPSLWTSSTEATSTLPPLSPARRSTAMPCPVVTRYCLPPVASTASMRAQPFPGRGVTVAYGTTAAGRASTSPVGPEILGQLLAHPEPRAVHARFHRGQADAERLGDVGVGQPLDVVHHERGPVVGRQAADGALEHLAQLAGERALVHALGPVGHRLEVTAVAVERGQHVVERHLARLAAPRAELLVGGVGRDAVDPAAERRFTLERADPARGPPPRGCPFCPWSWGRRPRAPPPANARSPPAPSPPPAPRAPCPPRAPPRTAPATP